MGTGHMAGEKILVVDDEEHMRESLKDILSSERYEIILAGDGDEALKLLNDSITLIIADVRMPKMDGFALLKEVKKTYPDIPVVMITAYGTTKLAVEAMKSGAYDYITKPFDPEAILIDVRKIVEHQQIVKENLRLKQQLEKRFDIHNIIGESQQIKDIIGIIKKVASTPSSVLIEGQSGTGKELIAKALHYLSDRRNEPFVIVNCAAIPDTLLESELFGHKKGSFTDAISDKKGRFEEADGGTIFLDEIGDMSLSLQSKILRVLQEKEFSKIGDVKNIKVDVRIISATNKNLAEEIQKGRFREDLYFRINVINVKLPPLVKRKDDIPLLADFFVKKYSYSIGKQIKGISDSALQLLKQYNWPGNIRELENLMERAIIFTTGEVIEEDVIKENLLYWKDSENNIERFLEKYHNYKDAVENFEKKLILKAFEKSKGHFSNAAKELGISRHSLRYQINKLGLKIEEKDS